MAKDMPEWGQVVPFARSAGELQRRALSQRRAKQWLEAVELLRRAAEQEPSNEQVLLDLADTYMQMGCATLSNRALLRALRLNPERYECFFALGANFYAERAWAQAKDCLGAYVRHCPEGENRREANDMLLHLYLHRTSRVERRISRATRALETGNKRLAARLMRRVFAIAPMDSDTHAIASFLHLTNDRPELALGLARRAWRLDRSNARALCAMSMALHHLGNRETSRRMLARAAKAAQGDEERAMIANAACQMEADALALPVLVVLARKLPLEPSLLHMLAVCYCRLGRYRDALPLWARMRRIDPDDTVAAYCFDALREAMAKEQPFTPFYPRQVPMEETLRRLGELRQLADHDAQTFLSAWHERIAVRRLAFWGLSQPELRIREVMLGFLRVVGDESVLWALRDALLEVDPNDAFKHRILELLFELGDPGPHYTVTSKGFTTAFVRVVEEETLPHAHALGLKQLALRLRRGNAYGKLVSVWKRLLRDEGTLLDAQGWLISLEWLYRARRGEHDAPLSRLGMRRVRRLETIWEE